MLKLSIEIRFIMPKIITSKDEKRSSFLRAPFYAVNYSSILQGRKQFRPYRFLLVVAWQMLEFSLEIWFL